MDKRYRDYFLVSFSPEYYAERIKILQLLTDIKIHPPYGHKYPNVVDKFSGRYKDTLGGKTYDGYHMMISCRKIATDAVIYELNKAKRNDYDSKWEQI